MGETTLIEQDLTELKLNKSENKTVYRNKPPELFRTRWYGAALHWFQKLKLTGNYRMELELSEQDVLRVLKASYGTVLGADLIEKYGFELSPELEKAALRKVKLADLTLGDLAALSAEAASERQSDISAAPREAAATVTPIHADT